MRLRKTQSLLFFFLMSTIFFPFLRVSSMVNASYQILPNSGTIYYPPPPVVWEFWTENSYWRMKIPENAPLHPDSDKMVEWLKGPGSNYQNGHVIVNWQAWTKPIYDASEDTPKVTVYKSNGRTVRFYNVPIDPSWEPASDADHSIGIIDWSGWKYYDFWNIFYEGGVWKSGAGYVYDLDSTGVAPNRVWTVGGSSTPFLAMAIRDEEIEAGVINHPLSCCLKTPKQGVKVYPPAATTDGKSLDTYAIPEGARIQLDPNLDLDSLGLSRTARIIAKAMQEYGIVVKESGGAWALYAEHKLSANCGSDMSNGVLHNLPTDKWRIVDYSVFGATEEAYP